MTLSTGWQELLLFAFVLVLTISAGARLIPLLKRWSFGQHAYEDAPKTHALKTGTPTMGGLLFLLALVATAVVAHLFPSFRSFDPTIDRLAILGIGCGFVGFIDDYLSIRRDRNRGLRARTKLFLTASSASGYFPALYLASAHLSQVIASGSVSASSSVRTTRSSFLVSRARSIARWN